MKIGILCTIRNGFGKKGFYNSQEIGLGRQLAADGHRVVIYKGMRERDFEGTEKDYPAPGIVVNYIPMKGFGVHGYFNVRHLDSDLDCILSFTDTQLFIPHVIRFCRRKGICFIPYFGTTFSMYETFRGRIMNTLFRVFTAPIYRNMRVLAKTEGVRMELYEIGIRKTLVVPAGIDLSVLHHDFRKTDRHRIREEHGYKPEDRIIFSIARMEVDKRPGDMVEILNRIRDRKEYKLLIIGKGPLRKEVDRKIRDYHLEDRVRILDHVPYDEIWTYFRMADYFLNLNRAEIFGMAVMEAVYYCVPVAAIRAPGPSTILNGMKGHTLCSDDREAAAALCAVYPSHEDLEASAKKLTENFSWKRCARAVVRMARDYNRRV